jgi:flavin reductase (DIM6/NTAB) family NADH-FMN oxidoreductase RutF
MKIETANLGRRELHNLIGTAISPLPIALVSTIGPDGIYNAAPFSFVAPVCSKPPIICIAIGVKGAEKKDTIKNIEFSKDFVINVVDETLIQKTIQASSSYPSGTDEIKEVGLTAVGGEMVKSPRIAESKVSLECRLVQKLEIMEELRDGEGLRAIVFAEVVLAHLKDGLWVEGRLEPACMGNVGRVGDDWYCKTGDIFELKHP